MKKQLILCAFFIGSISWSQNEPENALPYYEIPEAPENYTAGTVVSRMIDGLGFRYYWATEGLREEDLAYKPSLEARTSGETIDHIYNLSKTIINAAKKMPTDGTLVKEAFNFAEKRKRTLENLKEASELFKITEDLAQHKLIFINSGGTFEYPFWNEINGPIEDAVWHCGQVVLLRRASGNPFNSKASVFMGKVRQ